MGFVFIPLYIKYLGIEAYGLIGLFAVLQVWLSLLDMGMTPTLNREMAKFTGGTTSIGAILDLLRSIEIVMLITAVLVGVGIWCASAWLASDWLRAERVSTDNVAKMLTIMGIITAIGFPSGIYRSAVIGLQRQVILNIATASLSTIRGFGAVGILMWVSPTIEAFFLWQGIISVLSLIVMAMITYGLLPRSDRRGSFSWEALRNVWHFAGGIIGITFLSLLLTHVDKILLSRLLTLSEFGYYTLAYTAAGALYMLINPITQAWYPRLCELHALNDHAALSNSYHRGSQLVTIVAGSSAIVVMLFSEILLQLWTRDIELAAKTALILRILIMGNLLNGLMMMPYKAQLAHGWTKLTMRIDFISVLVIVPAILWTVPRWGGIAAACVWAILNSGYVVIGIYFMHKKILTDEKIRWYIDDVGWPLIGAAIGALSVFYITSNSTGVEHEIVVILATGISSISMSIILTRYFPLAKMWKCYVK